MSDNLYGDSALIISFIVGMMVGAFFAMAAIAYLFYSNVKKTADNNKEMMKNIFGNLGELAQKGPKLNKKNGLREVAKTVERMGTNVK
jgi:glycerol uptake facilitator-like aquaporin